jgi:hypothetical protein
MTTTQLVGVLTLVGTLRVEKIEHAQDTADSERNYLHGKIDLP